MKEKSIPLELHVEQVTIHAGHRDFPNINVNFRKSITYIGVFHTSSIFLKLIQA